MPSFFFLSWISSRWVPPGNRGQMFSSRLSILFEHLLCARHIFPSPQNLLIRVSHFPKNHLEIVSLPPQDPARPLLLLSFTLPASLSLSIGFFPFACNRVQELPAWQTDWSTLALFPGFWSHVLARNITGMTSTANEPSLGPAPGPPTDGYLSGTLYPAACSTWSQPYLLRWASEVRST